MQVIFVWILFYACFFEAAWGHEIYSPFDPNWGPTPYEVKCGPWIPSDDINASTSCSPSTCMHVWTENLMQSWLETTNYRMPTPRGPTWNFLQAITCAIRSAASKNVVCGCYLPPSTYQNLNKNLRAATAVVLGDSTSRNYHTFMHRRFLPETAFLSLMSRDHVNRIALTNMTGRVLDMQTAFTKPKPRPEAESPAAIFYRDNHKDCAGQRSNIDVRKIGDYPELSLKPGLLIGGVRVICDDAKKTGRVAIFISSIALHYLERKDQVMFSVTRDYEKSLLIRLHAILRGAIQSECLSRFLLVFRAANQLCHKSIPDQKRAYISECLVDALKKHANPTPVEMAEIRDICERRTFDSVGSVNLDDRASAIIKWVNICIQSDPDDSSVWIKWGQRLEQAPTGAFTSFSFNEFCPNDLRGILWSFSKSESAKKSKIIDSSGLSETIDTRAVDSMPVRILRFPGDLLAYFVCRLDMFGDGRHYGLIAYLNVLRMHEGIAHEWMRFYNATLVDEMRTEDTAAIKSCHEQLCNYKKSGANILAAKAGHSEYCASTAAALSQRITAPR